MAGFIHTRKQESESEPQEREKDLGERERERERECERERERVSYRREKNTYERAKEGGGAVVIEKKDRYGKRKKDVV